MIDITTAVAGTKLQRYGIQKNLPSLPKPSADTFAWLHVAKMPINPKLASLCDKGELESYEGSLLSEMDVL